MSFAIGIDVSHPKINRIHKAKASWNLFSFHMKLLSFEVLSFSWILYQYIYRVRTFFLFTYIKIQIYLHIPFSYRFFHSIMHWTATKNWRIFCALVSRLIYPKYIYVLRRRSRKWWKIFVLYEHQFFSLLLRLLYCCCGAVPLLR